jgi:hypothetical protein
MIIDRPDAPDYAAAIALLLVLIALALVMP